MYADIGTITADDILKNFGRPDVIWASPDCTTYSIAAISHHRRKEDDGNLAPVSEYANPRFKPPCHNGDPCHVAAPRGAKTGTQGLKGHIERSIIPDRLCDHIVDICENERGD